MPRRTNLEVHLANLQSVEIRSLTKIRNVRRQIWRDEEMDPVDRVVLALSGSAETLLKYQELARKVGELIGEPIIQIQSMRNDRASLRDKDRPDWVESTFGGIIAGEMYVGSQSLVDTSGHATLEVPVDPLVSTQHFAGDSFRIYREGGTSQRAVKIAHLIIHDWDTGNGVPQNIFQDGQSNVVMGRPEIYRSEHFQRGLIEPFLAIEAAEAAIQPSL